MKILKSQIFVLLLILISLLLCYKNYTPNTILSGWDTIHPEFNLGQYWEQITSVWQQHQGLGAPPSQAHASEIPRMLIYSLLTLILPLSFVRYSYVFLMLIIGPIGLYYLLSYILKHKNKGKFDNLSAFLGALFYLLNLGTMQHFVVVLEMFATNFGFLGFIFLFASKFIDRGKKSNLIILLIFVFFASSMAHTATLWYVFYLGLISYCLIYAWTGHAKQIALKKTFIISIFVLLINFYWILPNIYYSVNYAQDVINSKINRIGTEELYLHNRAYGNVTNLLLLRNFLFDWQITQSKNIVKNGSLVTNSQNLLQAWSIRLNQPLIESLGYFLSLMALCGVAWALIKKNHYFASFMPILVVSAIFLLTNIEPIASIVDLTRQNNSFFKETLRFPFTKFSLYYIFIISLGFGYFNNKILNLLSNKKIGYFYGFIIFLLIIIFNFPSFQGELISKVIRVKIPTEYYQLFGWSQQQPKGRILQLPLHSIYGWGIYGWNEQQETQIYQGAGFSWFGLKQAIMNREFDRWYPYNEQSYREFSYALYSRNPRLFETLLSKYNINYILYDKNTLNPGSYAGWKTMFYLETEELISQISPLQLNKQFGNNIYIYDYSKNLPDQEIYSIKQPINALPSYQWGYVDQAYLEWGDYITSNNSEDSRFKKVSYVNRDIFDKKERIRINGITRGDYYQASALLASARDCDPEKSELKFHEIGNDGSIEYYTQNGSLCDGVELIKYPENSGYIISVESKNVTGLPLRICVEESSSKKCIFDDELTHSHKYYTDSFYIPPYSQGANYFLNFTNLSIGNVPTDNWIKSINIFPVSLYQPNGTNIVSKRIPTLNKQTSTYLYSVQIEDPNQQVLVLNQAYEKNWKAYFVSERIAKNAILSLLSPLFGKEINNHILVNNWANGWTIDPLSQSDLREDNKLNIVIVFWPQYLQFVGYGLLAITILMLLIKRRKTIKS